MQIARANVLPRQRDTEGQSSREKEGWVPAVPWAAERSEATTQVHATRPGLLSSVSGCMGSPPTQGLKPIDEKDAKAPSDW